MLQIFYVAINLNQIFLLSQNITFLLSWLNKASTSFEIFSLLLNEKILCERTISFKNNTLTKFITNTMCKSCSKYPRLGGCATSTSSFSAF